MRINSILEKTPAAPFIAIGQVDGRYAESFLRSTQLKGAVSLVHSMMFVAPLYLDPDFSLYQAFGLGSGLQGILQPTLAWRMLRSSIKPLLSGHGMGRPKTGSAGQLGGLFVVSRDGKLLYEHREAAPGDSGDFDLAVRIAMQQQSML